MPLKLLIELLAPDDCLACGQEGSIWCNDCIEAHALRRPTCYRCNRLVQDGATCRSCRRLSALAGVTTAAYFDGTVKEIIHKLKYERQQTAASSLASLIQRALPQRSFDVVTAVPAHPSRRRLRGYNQSELIARQVASSLALPYLPLLIRTSKTSQVGARRSQRFTQAKGAFMAVGDCSGKILLVDDVITTGATLNECAKELKTSGAKSVWGATAARH